MSPVTETMQHFLKKCREIKDDPFFGEVEALAVGGSVSRGEVDSFSDLDFFMLVSGCDMSLFLRTRMRRLISLLGDLWLFRGPVFVEGFGYSFSTLYSTLLACQFNVNDRNSLVRNAMRSPSALMVFDKTGFYTDFLESCKGLKIDEREVFCGSSTFFWLRSLNVWRDINRGHLWLAIRHLTEMRDQMFILKRLIHESPPPGLNHNIPSKAIESDLGKDLADTFCGSLAQYSLSSIVEAFSYCIRSFLDDMKTYAGRDSPAFNEQLVYASSVAELILADLQRHGAIVAEISSKSAKIVD